MNAQTCTRLTSAILLALLAYAPATFAATKTDTFTVSATVAATCKVQAHNLNLGTYDGAALSGVSTHIDVSCTSGEPYDVGLNFGGEMTNGMAHLHYSLCKDSSPSCPTPWGNSNSGLVHGTGTGSNTSIPVWGVIPAGQIVNHGTYQDTVLVTVTYM